MSDLCGCKRIRGLILQTEECLEAAPLDSSDECLTSEAMEARVIRAFSPSVKVERTPDDDGVIITITDIDGVHTSTVRDGEITQEMLDKIASMLPAPEKLRTARTIALTGEAAGQADFDGSQDIEIYTAIATLTNEELEEMLK